MKTAHGHSRPTWSSMEGSGSEKRKPAIRGRELGKENKVGGEGSRGEKSVGWQRESKH